MPLDWDVLLDDVSIKTQIAGFQVRESKGAYARELTLFAADPDFYDLFDYTAIPQLRIEIKTKIAATWISQGKFFIERPGIFATPDSIMSPGVWGRSATAVAGPPFAAKVSKTWAADTTVQSIITEMADLCDLTVTFDIDDYTVFANSYAVDGIYPIDVISELAGFCGGHVGCTPAGAMVIRPEIFHPAAADYTITDDDIADISENIEYPEFGNRIRIGALGAGSGYQVDLEALDDSDCLPADGVARGTLLAFVTDNEGEPVPDNTIVSWTIEDGAALDAPHTNTGNYLLTNRKHQAENYYTVSVDYPISDVIGIWAYADSYGQHNFWDDNGSFDGKKITVANKFSFCDQMLRIAYVTAGCAVNKVTAGSAAMDVEVSADVEGAKDTISIYIGNPCACGSSLNAKVNPYGAICFGNLAHILVWATINNAPAAGYPVQLRITSGCGELSSENKTLQTAEIINELSHVNNDITGVSQVETEIIPADVANPQVYLKSDTAKAVDLYASHDGKLIDLTTLQSVGEEVVIDYHADGATLVAWRTIDVDKECDSEVTIKMSDGTEAGLKEEVNFNAVDCAEPDDIPDYSGDWSDYDPANDDQNSDSGGFEDDGNDADSGAALLGPCDVTILNRVVNIDNAVGEDDVDNWRFGTNSTDNCPEEEQEWECSCAELCESEVHYKGGTYDESQTIHEIIIAAGETEGTPAYNEAFEVEQQGQLDACVENCQTHRGEFCEACDAVTGPATLVPGESAEYVCDDGITEMITMPLDQCGVYTTTVGCCSVNIRSTVGQWVETATCGPSSDCSSGGGQTAESGGEILEDNKTKVFEYACVICTDWTACGNSAGCPTNPEEDYCNCESRCCGCSCGAARTALYAGGCPSGSQDFSTCGVSSYTEWEWQC
ncbi:MAG: Ig-like domain-containing protein [Desulfobacterales bacterium]|nr:Ig-like domain-containing protein [Desulfobacterales bacterium]